MARSFSPPKAENAIEDFTKSNYHVPSDTHYEMLRRGGTLIQRRCQIGFDGDNPTSKRRRSIS
jgi:hypothetical protein